MVVRSLENNDLVVGPIAMLVHRLLLATVKATIKARIQMGFAPPAEEAILELVLKTLLLSLQRGHLFKRSRFLRGRSHRITQLALLSAQMDVSLSIIWHNNPRDKHLMVMCNSLTLIHMRDIIMTHGNHNSHLAVITDL